MPEKSRHKADTAIFYINDMADLNLALSEVRQLELMEDASNVDRSLVTTIISELGSNIIKYANRGFLRIYRIAHKGNVDIDIWAEDEGPGIGNVELAMQDHYTTGNSLGLGLPGVKRMADSFWIRSSPEKGTLVYAKKRVQYAGDAPSKPQDKGNPRPRLEAIVDRQNSIWDICALVRPMHGETLCGDLVKIVECGSGLILFIADVTGHGERAHQVASMLSELLDRQSDPDIVRLFGQIHERLKGTVGAAAGALYINLDDGRFNYVAVGNTNAKRCIGDPWRGISKNGILGQRLPTLYEQNGRISRGDVVALWTDGVSELHTREYVSKNFHKPSKEIAHGLVNELGKPYDDAGCIILRCLK
jgi:anti-sigma regulatory factor (Ser/Thr protein kinase)